VSPAINRCELSYIGRVEIDLERAAAQHRAYEEALRALGIDVISLPAEDDFPDCVFVEDPAIVLDEIAILTRPGAESRRGEGETLAPVLSQFRGIERIAAPGTLEGGDVMRVEKTLYVGSSARSNQEGAEQLAEIVRPFGYNVKRVPLRGCLHLKSGVTYLGKGIVVANRDWVEVEAIEDARIVDVAEPEAANILTLGQSAIMPDCFPGTRGIVEALGWKVTALDISELRKAEAGVTCSSLVFVG
jgi:dimethylargininase